MLSRFCTPSLKLVRSVQNSRSILSRHAFAPSFLIQNSKYATAAVKVDDANNLDAIIKEMKNRLEDKSQISLGTLNSILQKSKSHSVDSEQALEILRCVSQAQIDRSLYKTVKNIWTEFKKNSKDFRTQHYNCLLQLSRDKYDAEYAQAIFDEMSAAGMKPDPISYQCLLSVYCRLGDVQKCQEILTCMANENLYINEASYNNVVQCYINSGNIDAAEETIVSLKQNGHKLNYFTLDVLLSYYSKLGDIESIQRTFDRFKEEEIEMLNSVVMKCMCELAKHGHAAQIESLKPHLKQSMELKSLFNGPITDFVKLKQSSLVPEILQCIEGDSFANIKHLIKEMVRLSSPESEFKHTFEKLEALGITMEKNFDIYKLAVDSSSEEMIRRILTHMKSQSMELRESIFERLFQLSAGKGPEKVLDAVKLMCEDCGIQPQITFMRDTILPALRFKENPTLVASQLETTTIRRRIQKMAIINSSLSNGDVKTAYEFASKYATFYGISLIKRPLLNAYITSNNITDFVQFVRLIHDSFTRINEYNPQKQLTDDEILEQRKAFVNEMLYSAVINRRKTSEDTVKILKEFIDEGMPISTNGAKQIREKLKIERDSQIDQLLTKLSSESLQLKPVQTQRNQQTDSDSVANKQGGEQKQARNSAEAERVFFLAKNGSGNVSEKEVANAESALSNADAAQLIDLYAKSGNLDSALNSLKRICTNNPSFKLDHFKTARLVSLMIEKNRDFEEVESLLIAHQNGAADHRIFILEHAFDKLAAIGNDILLEKLIDTLFRYHYIDPTMECLSPLVTVHLTNQSYDKALAKYEYLYETYNFVPMTMVLFVKLIQNNHPELLQRAFDTLTRAKGASTALSRLALAFCECDKEHQVRLILKNDQIKNLSKTIANECRQYVQYGRTASAKTLLKATKGLDCDRHCIYQCLLDIYQKENKAQDALDLWCEYSSEEGMVVKTAFQNKLKDLLKTNNIEPPFNLNSPDDKTEINKNN